MQIYVQVISLWNVPNIYKQMKALALQLYGVTLQQHLNI